MLLRAVVATSLVVLGASVGPALAGPLEIWAYSVQPGPELTQPYNPDPVSLHGNGLDNNDGWLNFTLGSASGLRGGQTIRLATLWAQENYVGDPFSDDRITYFDDPYSLQLKLQNAATGQVGTVWLSGEIAGNFSTTQGRLTNLFTSPATQTLTLGGTTYTVSAAAFTGPDTVDPNFADRLVGGGIDVTVTPASTPEPTTLALAGVGLVAALATRRRNSVIPI